MTFEILVKDVFDNFKTDEKLKSTGNKSILGLLNDFENGSWRFDKFQNYIWDNIKETALSQNERRALINKGEGSVLAESAKKLRLVEGEKAFGRGSEIAEIVLYGIMNEYYSALPVVPKIFYKQNAKDEAKGADSVHIVVESEDRFSLWFGESKFYNSIDDSRLDKIVDSVKESISLTKIKKENSIITNLSDINDFEAISPLLKEKIKKILAGDESVDNIKTILNIPILLLYQCELTGVQTLLTTEYRNDLINIYKERVTAYFKKQIDKCSDIHLYDKIKFHIILFPVADKKRIVDTFILKARAHRE